MIKFLPFAILLLLIAAGCSPQDLPDAPTPIRTLYPATLPAVVTLPPAETGQAEPAQTPEPGETAQAADGAIIQVGQQVFEQNCSVCHTLTNETRVGPGLAGLFDQDQLPNGNPVTEENLREWIHNGGGAMPPVPLPDDEMDAVIAFLAEATQ